MEHLALYRKWRPTVFEDIIGQSHITKTLKNQIVQGRVGHAYLFCGTRGTGKTTCAKVFSRAVNCLSPKNGSPCNECEICKGILDGSILDVTELDAASNNGVENIRDLISDTAYVAAEAKYSIYIIDEVHMLSNAAFNALLKTLEEPPERVIFILATTDPQKVPQTILSRCQRFDFKRISVSDIELRLKEVAHGDGINVTEDGLRLIARLGDGSMRDALSVLERVASEGAQTISAKTINEVLGISARDSVVKMADALISGDASGIISVIDALMRDGKDLHTFIDSLLSYLRDMMICSLSPDSASLLDYGDEDIVKLKGQSRRMPFERITRAANILSGARADAKWVRSPRIIYELALIKVARPQTDDSPDALLDRLAQVEKGGVSAARDEELYERINNIEEKIKNGLIAKEPPKEEEKPKEKKISKRIYDPIPEEELNGDNPIIMLAKRWDSVSAAIVKRAGYFVAALANRPITVDRDGIVMLFDRRERFAVNMLGNNRDKLEKIFAQVTGTDYAIKFVYRDEVEDAIVDIWSLRPSSAKQSDDEGGEDTPSEYDDPLDELSANFGELIESTDGTEFMDYDSSKDSFEQEDVFESDKEEFLEGDERKTDREDETDYN